MNKVVLLLPTLIKIATLLHTVLSNCNFKWLHIGLFTGPKLPMRLFRHAMVQLGNGLAIIGGSGDGNIQAKIHLLICLNRNCSITTLSQELSVPRFWFLAIPIPDKIAGCISGGKKCQKKLPDLFLILNLFSPKFFQSASWLLLLEMGTAMITPIICIVTLMGVTAVVLVWTKNTALNVFVRAVEWMWESQIPWWEMGFVMI